MKQVGFTMIELLVVIAIIAILAAIIFPAAVAAKDAAYRSSDMSHLNELRTALQLYRTDQGAYPPEMFGYVNTYASPPVPADQIQGYLFPKRVPAISTFQPAYDRSSTTTTVGGDGDPIGDPSGNPAHDCGTTGSLLSTQPPTSCVYWPGPPISNPACYSQAYGDDTPVLEDPSGQTNSSPVPTYYAVDGYDVAPEQDQNGHIRYVIHYALFWTGYGIGNAACTTNYTVQPGSASDSMKQLGYANPPDNTVITWDSYFRNYTPSHTPELGVKRDVVLFLGGNAKMYDSNAVYQNAWNISP